MFDFLVNQTAIGLGALTAGILFRRSRKPADHLPEAWSRSAPERNFRLGVLFLMIYLVIDFLCEGIAFFIAINRGNNNSIYAINYTLFIPFSFGFLYLHTQTAWKRYVYILLYATLVAYFAAGGYYNPGSVLTGNSSLVIFSISFLAPLIHLTDLLVNPKTEYFRFQLKISLCMLVNTLLACAATSFSMFNTNFTFFSQLIFYVHFYNMILFYLSLAFIFTFEFLKLRRG